jgi:hypothetical protein
MKSKRVPRCTLLRSARTVIRATLPLRPPATLRAGSAD